MNNYHFNNSQWRVLLDQPDLEPRADRGIAINRDYVTLSNGEVFHVGGKWLDDDNTKEGTRDELI